MRENEVINAALGAQGNFLKDDIYPQSVHAYTVKWTGERIYTVATLLPSLHIYFLLKISLEEILSFGLEKPALGWIATREPSHLRRNSSAFSMVLHALRPP